MPRRRPQAIALLLRLTIQRQPSTPDLNGPREPLPYAVLTGHHPGPHKPGAHRALAQEPLVRLSVRSRRGLADTPPARAQARLEMQVSLISASNDEVERRGVAPTPNE